LIRAKVGAGEDGIAYFGETGSYFCIHSHLSATTQEDYDNLLDSSYTGTTEIDERIAMLESLATSYGVEKLVVSTLVGGAEGDSSLEGIPLDILTLHAAVTNPDFFVPFVRGFDVNDPDLAWIATCLLLGFQGVGELFCYGYPNELAGPEPLIEVCRLAASAYVPVAVHWEIGNRSWGPGEEDRTPPDVAYDHLLALLAAFPKDRLETFTVYSEADEAPLPFRLILCHCGSGPTADDATLVGEYVRRLDELLDNYPNVYFDLAGMQGPEGPVLYKLVLGAYQLTLLGAELATRMDDHPDRFLFGVDANETPAGLDSAAEVFSGWAGSIPNYETFLTLTGISDSDKLEMFRYWNAVRVLYTGPIEMGAASISDRTIDVTDAVVSP